MCGAPGTENITILEFGGVISTSSALRFPLEVSEQSGDDRGAWYGAVSDVAAMREKEASMQKQLYFDDDEEAIGVGEGLYRRVRPKAMKMPVFCGLYLVSGLFTSGSVAC